MIVTHVSGICESNKESNMSSEGDYSISSDMFWSEQKFEGETDGPEILRHMQVMSAHPKW